MSDVIIIKQKFTANTITISVKMPGKVPISKQWRRTKGGFAGKFEKDWNEEPSIPPEVSQAAAHLHARVCDEIKSQD